MPHAGGRPTLLTDEVQKQIVADIEAGNYIETACLAAGISPRDYQRWNQWGREGKEPYAEFCRVCACARAKAEKELLATASKGDAKGTSFGKGKAAAWLLERTRPQKYAQRINLTLEKELEKILATAERVLEPGQFEKLVEALSAPAISGEETEGDPGE